ncbi:hypothetical protein Hanom_Chr03g00179971 [Helianthus anomalus]
MGCIFLSSHPPKSLHDWKQKFFYIRRGVIPVVEMALVGAGMSMLWVPKNPRGVYIYGYQGKVGYSLLNVLDPKAGGAMIEEILPEGKPVWLVQIRHRFLHPTSDSFVAYANIILGEDCEDDFDDTTDLTREEVIVLSSEGSDRSCEGLVPHSSRAGPAQGAANEHVNEPVDVDKKEVG